MSAFTVVATQAQMPAIAMASQSYAPVATPALLPRALSPQPTSQSYMPMPQSVATAVSMTTSDQPSFILAPSAPVTVQASPMLPTTSSAPMCTIDMVNQAIRLGEVEKPTRASEYYELYSRACVLSANPHPGHVSHAVAVGTPMIEAPRQTTMSAVVMNGQSVPTCMTGPSFAASYAAAGHQFEQIPAKASVRAVVPVSAEKKSPNMYVDQGMLELGMCEQPPTCSYVPSMATAIPNVAVAAPTIEVAAPTMAVAAPAMAFGEVDAQGPESIVLDEVGEWLVCEDAMGLFFYHSPTAQSYDAPPMTLIHYYESHGVQLAPTGAFGAKTDFAAVQA